MFPSPRGAPLRYSNFRSTVWLPALERLGFGEVVTDAVGNRIRFRPAFGMHALRHSAGAAMIHAGASPKSVQSILGHANAAFTLTVYAHLFDDDLDAVAEGLERVVAAPLTGPIRDRDGTATVLAFPTSL